MTAPAKLAAFAAALAAVFGVAFGIGNAVPMDEPVSVVTTTSVHEGHTP